MCARRCAPLPGARSRYGEFQKFDVLVIDAFSGDAIPTHLLTKEAFEVYLQHLRSPDSVIALHISNLSLNLAPVVSGLAHQFNLLSTRIHHPESRTFSGQTDWVLLSPNPTTSQDPSSLRWCSSRLRCPHASLDRRLQ